MSMTIKELMEILKGKALVYLNTLSNEQKKELANDYKKKTKRTNTIFAACFFVLFLALVSLANILDVYGYRALGVICGIVSIVFLAIGIFGIKERLAVDKISDEEAALNGAIKLVQKNTDIKEVMESVRLVVGGEVTPGENESAPTDRNAEQPLDSNAATPATIIDESVSGKESEGEGEKLEGEGTRQKFGIEEKSVAELLAELKDLLDQGLITNEDYERKKAEILAKL